MNPVEKRKLDIRNTITLDNFKSNLLSDGTYTFDEDILTKSYRHLPHHMRNADLTMVAGAYGSGKICAYDNLGNIVDLGFSRADQRSYIDGNKNILLANANIPRLDYLTYKSSIFGYLIEQSGYTWQGNTSFYRVPNNGVSDVINGNNTFSQPWTMTENAVNGTVRSIATEPIVGQFSGVGVVTVSMIFRLNSNDRKISVSAANGAVVGSSTIIVNPNDNSFIHTGATPSCFDISIRNYYEDWKIFKFSINVNYISNPYVILRFILTNLSNQAAFVGEVGNVYEVMSFTSKYNDTSESVRYGNTDVNTFQTNLADTITPITLTNDAIIHIKTAKGIQEFILPAGTFDVNDYVVNDKLICFAIKYLPDIEDFINNLTLNGTYTFDDDVIRDSWSDLMNRISTNSTLLHQFCNADHIVLPYAYKTGYVAAMDLSDGGIVDIEFERSGTRYRIFDDVIDTPINVIRLDNICYDELIGYTFEEETNYIAGSRPYFGVNLTSTIGTSVMGNPSTFYETSANSQKYTHWDASSSWSGMNSKDVTLNLIIKPVNFSGRYILLLFGEPSISNQGIVFDLENNIPVNISSYVVNSKIRLLQNGFRFITVTFKNVNKPPLNYTFFRFYPKTNTTFSGQNYVGDTTKGFEIANMSIGNSESESVHIAHITNGVNTKHKDHLKTESYSKICTIGVQTGMKVGSYTDPQSLVINDKINFILLKQ